MAATIQTIQKPTRARALDTSGNNNHGQIYSGRALEFDGVSDYLLCGGTDKCVDIRINSGSATFTCWFKADDVTPEGALVINGNKPGSEEHRLGLSVEGGVVVWNKYDAGGSTYAPFNSSTIESNTWYRAVGVIVDGTQSLYINGVAQTDTGNIQSYLSGTDDLTIGRTGSSTPSNQKHFAGKICDVQIWDVAWTAEDALYDYNNPEQLALNRGGTSLTNSNLKRWYPMNDGHRGQQSYILDASNTGLGNEMSEAVNGNSSNWTKYSNNTLSTDDGAVLITYVDNADGAYMYIRESKDLNSDLTIGVTYKVELDIKTNGSVAYHVNDNGGYALNATVTNTDFETYTAYFTATSATNNFIRIASMGAGEKAWFKNLSVKPVNDKNHATTVFYGDELITNGTMEADSNWADYNSVNANVRSSTQAHSGTYSRKFTVDGSSQGIQSDTFTTVTGRTYLLSFEIYPDDATTARIAIRRGDNSDWADDTSFSGLTQDAWNTKTVTYTETAGGSGAYLVVHGHGNTSGDFYVDDVSIKEVGTASGWTDADQQLDIPQTALQSYNQLLYGFDDTNGDFNAETYVKINDDSALDFGTNNFSASVWIRRDGDYPSHSNVFRKGGWSAIGFSIGFSSSEVLGINFSHTTGSVNYWAYGNTTIEKGKWYHIVGTWDRDGSQQLYVNGERQTMTGTHDISAKSALSMDSTEDIYINSMSTSTNGHFSGAITEFALFDNVLFGQDQVNELYNDGKALDVMESSQSTNCHGYWRNNGLAQWKDLSGNGNHSNTVVGSETMLITAGADGSRDSQGFIMNRQRTTNSLNLRGSISSEHGEGDYMNTSNKMSFAEDGFTLSFWVKYTDLSGRGITGMNDGFNHRMYIGQASAGADEMLYGCGDGYVTGTTNQITEGKWHHVLTTYDGGSVLKCYFDGVYDKTKTDITFSGVSTDNFWIGSFETEQYVVRGFIDDVLIYTDVKTDGGVSLTETAKGEIARIYNAGKRSHR